MRPEPHRTHTTRASAVVVPFLPRTGRLTSRRAEVRAGEARDPSPDLVDLAKQPDTLSRLRTLLAR